ncbi:conjugative transfer region protein TrbK [Novosphingobium capsulatum]|uniref:Conjugative transfer region protein TrbK n=1 Tax=Novosphingobium capsulatum TaxID=13688 RepID=A0ABU1MNR6_9SPHN|nr:putative entry exclusion protein TrbK-alt [Novosphingobium capsulatum]MDR6511959.1 conjugative transfer region protein TrbK [Novosphingobium capsulatum]
MVRTCVYRILALGALGLAALMALVAALLPAPRSDEASALPDPRPIVVAPVLGNPSDRRCTRIAPNDPAMATCATLWDAGRRRFFGLPTRQSAGAGPAPDASPAKETW